MPPSLIRISAARRRVSITTRLLIAWLSLSLVLTVTPCCKVYADAVAPLMPNAALDHEHDGPDGALHSPAPGDFHDPCTKWLGQAHYTLDSLHVAVTSGSGSHQDFPVALPLSLMPRAGTRATALFSYRPPPGPVLPLYLRIEHLLL